ncbi:MAG: squalene--hopene cyclase [Bdellovibrionales bacterium]
MASLFSHSTVAASVAGVNPDALERVLSKSAEDLLAQQKPDGHWVYELEADATIPAEYILLDHFLDTVKQPLHERMAVYLRSIQEEHGGWPLFHRGAFDMSASVKAYFALKCVGDDINDLHMIRARAAIIKHGGAEKSNVFTRIQLALFGAVPWRAVPVMPVEIMLLPRWFPFHLSKISYWSRTVIVPLLVLMAKKPMARNPRGIRVDELFVTPPEQVRNWHSNKAETFSGRVIAVGFRCLDAALRVAEPYFPKKLRQKSVDLAVAWVRERLNGDDGVGGIYPAMANTVMMFDTLGYPSSHPAAALARASVDKLVVDLSQRAYCQPCLSPVWDTALALHALLDAGVTGEPVKKACRWLVDKQILDLKGDWATMRPDVRPGGWAFQYNNAHYPDVDDTAVVAMALDRVDHATYSDSILRAAEWVEGMISKNGGWGAFDADNEYYYLNYIPFADHGALLDPPTADVSARCVSFLSQLTHKDENATSHAAQNRDPDIVKRGIDYLLREQEPEGRWFGRWGTNYIYGTWSSLCALNAAGLDSRHPAVRRAVDWLLAHQKEDGGWGEDGASYWKGKPKGECPVSTPSQTAWALLGLMAAGEVENPAVARGVRYLLDSANDKGRWREEYYTAVGFPRVFYLRYHGYKAYFPLWALARYRNLMRGNARQVAFGM